MTYFIRAGNTIKVLDGEAVVATSHLEPMVYTVKYNEHADEYFLATSDPFTLPSKVYGPVKQRTERILNTFDDRPASTGVLLKGLKGSGKTVLMKMVSIEAIAKGIPVLIIDGEHKGSTFNSFIQSIEQPVVILFDEFEKVYKYHEQAHLLTLLDGVYPTKKLFILSANDEDDMRNEFTNRPGRLYYSFTYGALEEAEVKEFCEDNLEAENMKHLAKIIRLTSIYPSFNYDMLSTLIEEINRYGETPEEVMSSLNIVPEGMDVDTYTITLTDAKDTRIIDEGAHCNPVAFHYHTKVYVPKGYTAKAGGNVINLGGGLRVTKSDEKVNKTKEGETVLVHFKPEDFSKFDHKSKEFTFKHGPTGASVVVKKNPKSPVLQAFSMLTV